MGIGEFDGAVTPASGGMFEAQAGGRVLGVFGTRELAQAAMFAAAGGGACWFVEMDGQATLLRAPAAAVA